MVPHNCVNVPEQLDEWELCTLGGSSDGDSFQKVSDGFSVYSWSDSLSVQSSVQGPSFGFQHDDESADPGDLGEIAGPNKISRYSDESKYRFMYGKSGCKTWLLARRWRRQAFESQSSIEVIADDARAVSSVDRWGARICSFETRKKVQGFEYVNPLIRQINLNKRGMWQLVPLLEDIATRKTTKTSQDHENHTVANIEFDAPVVGVEVALQTRPLIGDIHFPSGYPEMSPRNRVAALLDNSLVHGFKVYKIHSRERRFKVEQIGCYKTQPPSERIPEITGFRIRTPFGYKSNNGVPTCRNFASLAGEPGFQVHEWSNSQCMEIDLGRLTMVSGISTCARQYPLKVFPDADWFYTNNLSSHSYTGEYYWVVRQKCAVDSSHCERFYPYFECSYRVDRGDPWKKLGICKGPNDNFEEWMIDLTVHNNRNRDEGLLCRFLRIKPLRCAGDHRGIRIAIFGSPTNLEASKAQEGLREKDSKVKTYRVCLPRYRPKEKVEIKRRIQGPDFRRISRANWRNTWKKDAYNDWCQFIENSQSQLSEYLEERCI